MLKAEILTYFKGRANENRVYRFNHLLREAMSDHFGGPKFLTKDEFTSAVMVALNTTLRQDIIDWTPIQSLAHGTANAVAANLERDNTQDIDSLIGLMLDKRTKGA